MTAAATTKSDAGQNAAFGTSPNTIQALTAAKTN